MAAIPRRFRGAAIYVVVALVLLVVMRYHHLLYPSTSSPGRAASVGGFNGISSQTKQPGYVANAHRLDSADQFKGHFQAVMDLPLTPVEELRASCAWPEEEVKKVNWQFADVESLGWYQSIWDDEKTELWRSKLRNFVLDELAPYESSRFKGRGIVITGGNGNSKTRIETLLRQISRLSGSTPIPVEVHYWREEIDAEHREALRRSYPSVSFNDLSESTNVIPTTYAPKMPNYHLKIAAVLNARFEEMLILDSDVIPLVHPDELFQTSNYREFGAVFWPDVVRTRPENPAWGITNSPCLPDEYEMESGQMLINKRKFWYHLQVALWFMYVEGYEDGRKWPRSSFFLGDKDAFRFAWKALHTKYGRPSSWLSVVGYENKPTEFCGIAFGQYHPDKFQLAFFHANSLKYHHPEALEWVSAHNIGGPFGYIQQHPQSRNWSYNFPWGMAWDDQSYLPHPVPETEEWYPSFCSRMPHLPPIPLHEVLPGGFHDTWEAIRPEYRPGPA